MQHPTEVVLNITSSPALPPRRASWHTRRFFTWEKHICTFVWVLIKVV